MQDDQEWNAMVPSNALTIEGWLTGPGGSAGLALPTGSTAVLTFTNHRDLAGVPLPFDTPNGLVAPGELIHVSKPLTAIQDQLSLRRSFGKHSLSFGAYLANYTQENHWIITRRSSWMYVTTRGSSMQ